MTDFQRQKEEAANRVRRMNERYKQKAGISEPPKQGVSQSKSTFDILRLFRFDSIKNDPDRLIIMFVFLLLGSEKCDEKLLYALLYIML